MEQFWDATGEGVEKLDIKTLKNGTVVKVTTECSHYLLLVKRAEHALVEVFSSFTKMIHPRSGGSHGEARILEVSKRQPIRFNTRRTASVERIVIAGSI